MIRAPRKSVSTEPRHARPMPPWHARCGCAARRALAGIGLLLVISLAGAGTVSAAQRAAPTDLQMMPGIGVLSTSWSVTTGTGLAGFRVRWRPMTVPSSRWGPPHELGARARSYDIAGLSVGVYEVRVRALIGYTRRHGRRHRTLRRLGGLASGAATTLASFTAGSPAGGPPHQQEPPRRASEAPTRQEPPHAEEAERPIVEEPPTKQPPKEEPPKEEPPKEGPPSEEEPPVPGCSLYASPSGADGNSGTRSSPLRTVHALLAKLTGGETGCLAPGRYPALTVSGGESHGSSGAPVTITSTDAEAPATITGRIVTLPGADWLTFAHLVLSDSGVTYPSVTIGSAHTSWLWDDVSAPNTICFEEVGEGRYGPAAHTLIEHDRIHNCGHPFLCDIDVSPCNEPPNDGYHLHGIYDMGNFTTVRNNYIYENSSKGVLLRGGRGAVVEHNVIDGNGSGVLFGDLAPEGDRVAWNIITNSTGICETCSDYFGIWSFGSVGPEDVAINNDIFGNVSGDIGPHAGVKVKENIKVDPLYVGAAEHDYTLQPSSPALRYGPQ